MASCAPQSLVNFAREQSLVDDCISKTGVATLAAHAPCNDSAASRLLLPPLARAPSVQKLARAEEGVGNSSEFVTQVVNENWRLATKVGRLELECAKAEGRAQAKSEFISELSGRIESATARHEVALEEANQRAQVELRAMCTTHAQAIGTLEARVAKLSDAQVAPTERAGRGGSGGRGRANTKVPTEAAFGAIDYGNVPFFVGTGIRDKSALHDQLGTYDVARLKAYWPDDRSKIRAQAKQRAEFFLNLLALDTGKWSVGDAPAMFAYLLGTDDLGHLQGHFSNRTHQIAKWLWPTRVTSYSALVANTPATKYMYRRARHHMTGVKAVHALYEIWWGVREHPVGFREGVDAIPARKTAQKRKSGADADADVTCSSGLSD